MKCISLWDPWATLCVLGLKEFETRSWSTSYRGLLLIHAAKRWTGEQLRICRTEPFVSALQSKSVLPYSGSFELGCIIGAVEVKDIYLVGYMGLVVTSRHADQHPRITKQEAAFGDYTPGRYAWKLSNPIRFAKPIPYRGLQQLFNVPTEVVAEQLKLAGVAA